jgi:hypothetical protein
MNCSKHKWNTIISLKTLIIIIVFLFSILTCFGVYIIISEYQAFNSLNIEIIDIQLENESINNNIKITLRISNPTSYNTPQITMDFFIRPMIFSSDIFVAESKLSEIVILAENSITQILTFRVDTEIVDATLKGVTMKTVQHCKLLLSSIPCSKTNIYYSQTEEN